MAKKKKLDPKKFGWVKLKQGPNMQAGAHYVTFKGARGKETSLFRLEEWTALNRADFDALKKDSISEIFEFSDKPK